MPTADPVLCIFSPGKGSLALAADSEGIISVWDLRESGSLHAAKEFPGMTATLRNPSFTVLRSQYFQGTLCSAPP